MTIKGSTIPLVPSSARLIKGGDINPFGVALSVARAGVRPSERLISSRRVVVVNSIEQQATNLRLGVRVPPTAILVYATKKTTRPLRMLLFQPCQLRYFVALGSTCDERRRHHHLCRSDCCRMQRPHRRHRLRSSRPHHRLRCHRHRSCCRNCRRRRPLRQAIRARRGSHTRTGHAPDSPGSAATLVAAFAAAAAVAPERGEAAALVIVTVTGPARSAGASATWTPHTEVGRLKPLAPPLPPATRTRSPIFSPPSVRRRRRLRRVRPPSRNRVPISAAAETAFLPVRRTTHVNEELFSRSDRKNGVHASNARMKRAAAAGAEGTDGDSPHVHRYFELLGVARVLKRSMMGRNQVGLMCRGHHAGAAAAGRQHRARGDNERRCQRAPARTHRRRLFGVHRVVRRRFVDGMSRPDTWTRMA